MWGSNGSDVFAVGDGGHDPALRRQQLVGDEQRHDKNLYGVWGSSGSDVFAVGTRDDPALRRQQLVADEQRHGQHLYGVWGSSGSDVFAVGDSGTILHYDGSTWSAMSSGTTVPLRRVGQLRQRRLRGG